MTPKKPQPARPAAGLGRKPATSALRKMTWVEDSWSWAGFPGCLVTVKGQIDFKLKSMAVKVHRFHPSVLGYGKLLPLELRESSCRKPVAWNGYLHSRLIQSFLHNKRQGLTVQGTEMRPSRQYSSPDETKRIINLGLHLL